MQNSQLSQRSRIYLACVFVGFSLSLSASVADPVHPTALQPELHTILSTGTTVAGEPIRYPSDGPPLITAVEISFEPGQQTGWHTHPVPLFGYMLEGELTVDYGEKGQRIYSKGDALVEAMNTAHNGRNMGQSTAKFSLYSLAETVCREAFRLHLLAGNYKGRQIRLYGLEVGRLLDRDIAGLCPAQNLVDQLGGAPERVG